MKSMPVQIVCVVNKHEIFNDTIKGNAYLSHSSIHVFDNTKENVGISQRYNYFIQNYMNHESWIVFCHQDFKFLEDPFARLQEQDKNHIYGPIGAARRWRIFFRNWKLEFKKKKILGQIDIVRGDGTFLKDGIYLSRPKRVDTLDCCCIIVHASLIRKYKLFFDEHFSFHLYAEDYSLNAWYNHEVKTKALQMKCQHGSIKGKGNNAVNRDFYHSLEYLKSKYKGKHFVGTCF